MAAAHGRRSHCRTISCLVVPNAQYAHIRARVMLAPRKIGLCATVLKDLPSDFVRSMLSMSLVMSAFDECAVRTVCDAPVILAMLRREESQGAAAHTPQ
jgi:hypothetical protein